MKAQKYALALLSGAFLLSPNCWATTYSYIVEKNDQIGTVLLSLGHRRLWPDDGMVNLFKKRFDRNYARPITPGTILKINDEDIRFKRNVLIKGRSITFKRKIKTSAEYDELAKLENLEDTGQSPVQIKVIRPKEQSGKQYVSSFNLYPGAGLFVANNSEKTEETDTTTFTGLQPMLQLKGIYSHEAFGSLSFDTLVKKIVNNEYSFPVNLDYRLQFVPKWNFTDWFRLAFSHSSLKHSYVGKGEATPTEFELKSNFLGIGVVVPREKFWFEVYLEKAYSGETKSKYGSIKSSGGYRIDTELIYPISEHWRILPGLNYYQLEHEDRYKFNVLETRLVFAREFQF